MEIFKILFTEKKQSFFSKLVGKKTTLSEQDRQLARAKFRTLDEISKQIVQKLDALETRIRQLTPEEFAELY